MLAVNNELGVVILDLHPGNAIVAISDFSGNFLVQENVPIFFSASTGRYPTISCHQTRLPR